MRSIGVNPSLIPSRVTDGIGSSRSYDARRVDASAEVQCKDACCGEAAVGFSGTAGISSQNAAFVPSSSSSTSGSIPALGDIDALLLDIEG